MRQVMINCDLGELDGAAGLQHDLEILPAVDAINVACGFHAGGPERMWQLVKAAKEYDVLVGAHPSYPDRTDFGRREMSLPAEELTAVVAYQVGALLAIGKSLGVRINHVKPHGALYNVAARDSQVAEAVVEAVASQSSELMLVALAGSELAAAGRRAGLAVWQEGFADRGYRRDGSLVPRDQPGAIISDPLQVAARMERWLHDGTVLVQDIPATDGSHPSSWIEVHADTWCVHGDHANAGAIVKQLQSLLKREA